MKNFIKSLQRPDNKTLIEAILEGYNVIFEGDQLSLFKEGDIKLSPQEIAIKKAKKILSEKGDARIDKVIDNLTEEDGINELLIESLFKLKKIPYKIIEMVDNSKSLVFNINNEAKMISEFEYPVMIADVKELIMNGVSQESIEDIVPKGREYLLKLDEEFNKNFWESPSEVYHGTDEENVEDILNDGINARSVTRGISNRSVNNAVFASSDIETAQYFYDKVFEINTSDMKSDGYTPFVYQEPDIYEKNLAEALADLYDIENFHYDIEQGMDEGTIIFDGNIPPKYVELMN